MSGRKTLAPSRVHAKAEEQMHRHDATIDEIERALAEHAVVVVGMAQNPHVKRARRALDGARIDFKYIEYGSYFSEWRRRLAIKQWSGWPTFPQVFVRGVLVGGADLTESAIADGTMKELIAAPSRGAVATA